MYTQFTRLLVVYSLHSNSVRRPRPILPRNGNNVTFFYANVSYPKVRIPGTAISTRARARVCERDSDGYVHD